MGMDLNAPLLSPSRSRLLPAVQRPSRSTLFPALTDFLLLYRDKERLIGDQFEQLKAHVDIGDIVGPRGSIKGTEKGAADYPSFCGLLKQLVGPLSTQLSDRRSTTVKQVGIGKRQSNTVLEGEHASFRRN